MKTKIEAESKNGDLKREVVFGVNDDYDLRMSRDNTTKSIYITTVKKGSKLDLAGFKQGMRISKINGKRCPESYLKLVQTMMVKIEANDAQNNQMQSGGSKILKYLRRNKSKSKTTNKK